MKDKGFKGFCKKTVQISRISVDAGAGSSLYFDICLLSHDRYCDGV